MLGTEREALKEQNGELLKAMASIGLQI